MPVKDCYACLGTGRIVGFNTVVNEQECPCSTCDECGDFELDCSEPFMLDEDGEEGKRYCALCWEAMTTECDHCHETGKWCKCEYCEEHMLTYKGKCPTCVYEGWCDDEIDRQKEERHDV